MRLNLPRLDSRWFNAMFCWELILRLSRRVGRVGYRWLRFGCWLLAGVSLMGVVQAREVPKLTVGALQFGTVNWELQTIKQQGFDRQQGFELVVRPFANKHALATALQAGAVEMIVTDWIWVNQQRNMGHNYVFSPYSKAVGKLLVAPEAKIQRLQDLKGRRLGVAGGSVDKTWLIARAYTLKTLGQDLADWVEPQFAAPPLINQLAQRGELEATINFWHFSAKLQARGFVPLVDVRQMLSELGLEEDAPLIGWAFAEQTAQQHPELIKGMLQASQQAKAFLIEQDQGWEPLRALMKASDDAEFVALRDAFRAGSVTCFGEKGVQAASDLFDLLAQYGGAKVLGKATEFDRDVFWTGFALKPCSAS